MVELIHLVNDISTPVKLGWVGVLVWGVVQVLWYQRGRALPEEMDVEPATDGGLLSIAPAFDPPVEENATDLGAAAGIALESLLDADAADGVENQDVAEAFGVRKKRVSYQSTMSY